MELVTMEDIRHIIIELKKFVRIADPGGHSTLTQGSVSPADFNLSEDRARVNKDLTKGLSFATNMRKLKSIIKSKARFHTDIDIYAVDEHVALPVGLRFIKDRPGHASLVVTQDMSTEDLKTRKSRYFIGANWNCEGQIMKKIDNYIKKYILYYVEELDIKIGDIISHEKISSEQEAKDLLAFIDSMCTQSAIDMKEKKIVLDHPANTYDAEKAAMIIQDFVEDSGFDYLINDDLELE